ncbi:hypothetical protein AWJ20_4096 [Sugiyamaella lignohabitans]|uniref:Uncharacterized protein n=1 Tax=Sugiyamaella lignohabitans TaxID=796027 RepID=A0A167C6T5_9ASCO|nr:uncharacterized protein AWJ20_4096 [Sugiyamaella lignohabitans]ANB11292.1 hypothetical protein AWJ20_4096 [Sugiyamaella lignohabitans]
MAIPTPSKTAKTQAQVMAPFLVCFQPPRRASDPPVKKPAMIALKGSSVLRTPLTAQSKVENKPPQTPKLPPIVGARTLIADKAPARRSPIGEFLNPLIPCQIVPPITPIAKVAPKSFKMTMGQGSLE